MLDNIVTINPGAAGWPGEAADYMRACPFTRDGYGVADVAIDAQRMYGWRVKAHAHLAWTAEDWRALRSAVGTDPAIPIGNGYTAAAHFAIGAMLTAWTLGYTVRSAYRREDYAPPADIGTAP